MIYYFYDDKIHGVVDLFDNIIEYNYQYVIYEDLFRYYISDLPYDIKDFYKAGVSSDYIISYDDFLLGKLPKSILKGDTSKEVFNPELNHYMFTGKYYYLDKLDLGANVKCNCSSCNGYGFHSYRDFGDSIGVICSTCNGTGYEYQHFSDSYYVVKDADTGITYYVVSSEICGQIFLFNGLNVNSNVDYVMYFNSAHLVNDQFFETSKDFFAVGVNKDEIISYKKFLAGRLPLPMEKYACPAWITFGEFKNNCEDICGNKHYSELYRNCPKYGNKECWELFYGNAKTAGEKQEVLRTMKRHY